MTGEAIYSIAAQLSSVHKQRNQNDDGNGHAQEEQ